MKQFIECPGCGKPIIGTIIESSKDCITRKVGGLTAFSIHWDHKDCSQGMSMDPEDYKPLTALSIRQPWAWLIVRGYKDIENRSWNTNFRGKVLIHASQKFDKEGYEWVKKVFTESHISFALPKPKDFEAGGIVGHAEIIGCVQKSISPWFFGPSGFVLEDPHPLPFTPCKGKLSFFKPEIE